MPTPAGLYLDPVELPPPTEAEIAAATRPTSTRADRASVVRALAQRLGVDARALDAVIRVEAGRGLVDGRPVIRLEVHHLQDRTSGAARAAVDARFRRDPSKKRWEGHAWLDEGGTWRALHTGQGLEWRAYTNARSIAADAAMESTSWGLGQVLGEHWARLGYASRADFLAAQQTESGQLDTFARYIQADPVLLSALRQQDWLTIARHYNGTANARSYAAKLVAAFRA